MLRIRKPPRALFSRNPQAGDAFEFAGAEIRVQARSTGEKFSLVG